MEQMNNLQQTKNETVETIATNSVKRRKPILFVIIGIILVAVIAGIVGIIVMGGDERKIREQLDLGAKYLEELDYEQAILQYKLVLETDIQNKEALTKISETYGLIAEAETEYAERMEAYDMAIEYALLACGYYPEDVTLQELLVNTYINAGDSCLENENLADAEQYYKEAKKWAEKFSLSDKISQIEEKLSEIEQVRNEIEEAKAEQEQVQQKNEQDEAFFKPMYDMYLAGNIEKVVELSWEQAWRDEAEARTATEDSVYYGETNENGEREGVGIAVYNSNYFYLGEWKNGIREGNAYWIANVEDERMGNYSYVYECPWQNDKPNGKMKLTPYYTEEKTGARMVETEGNVIDGFYDGEIIEKQWTTVDIETYTYNYSMGSIQVIKRDETWSKEYPNVVAISDKGNELYWPDVTVEMKHKMWFR